MEKEGYGMKSVDIAMIPATMCDMRKVMEPVKVAGRSESCCVLCYGTIGTTSGRFSRIENSKSAKISGKMIA